MKKHQTRFFLMTLGLLIANISYLLIHFLNIPVSENLSDFLKGLGISFALGVLIHPKFRPRHSVK